LQVCAEADSRDNIMLMIGPSLGAAALPAFMRADGGVRLELGPTPLGTRALAVAESGGYRVRFPRSGEGVLINTGGGMAGGDRMRVEVTVRSGAQAVLTTQAAEKLYRSDGPDTEIAVSLSLERGSSLAWLPQEQILFDAARLHRTMDIAIAADASLTLVESVVFGRVARGERLESGACRDRWRFRRDGRLVLAEDVRLEGAVYEVLSRRASANGASALATFVHIAPEAERRAEEARALLAGAASEWGVSAFDGLLIARFVAAEPRALRMDLARFIDSYRRTPLPRSWQT
jgi:urease accessory protein